MTKQEAERIPFFTKVFTLEGSRNNPIVYERYVVAKRATYEDFIMLGLVQRKADPTTDASYVSSKLVHDRASECLNDYANDMEEEVEKVKRTLDVARTQHSMAFSRYLAKRNEEEEGSNG
jgi:hypothetical protein